MFASFHNLPFFGTVIDLHVSMASAQSSQDTRRGRDRQPQTLGNAQPHNRSESRHFSDRRRIVNTRARKSDNCPGALNEGDSVRVFSRSADKWVDGEIIEFVEDDFVHVEYEVGERPCGKILTMHSEHLIIPVTMPEYNGVVECDPGANFACYDEARQALRSYLAIRLSNKLHGLLTDVLLLQDVCNYAFICSLAGEPLTRKCRLDYTGLDDKDVLVKVHVLDAGRYAPEDFAHYEEYDFLHALLPDKHTCYIHPPHKKYFLGVTIHKDLSTDFRINMENMSEERRKRRQAMVSRLFKGRWKVRGDVNAETVAEKADYLISYCSKDKNTNDQILQRLSSEPIGGPHGSQTLRFCTDTSLGIGVHFYDGGSQLHTLHLGKHAFGMPPDGGWLEEYKAAAEQTRQGVLVLNPSESYFKSPASMREYREIELSRVWVFSKRLESIVSLQRFWEEHRFISSEQWRNGLQVQGGYKLGGIVHHDSDEGFAFVEAHGRCFVPGTMFRVSPEIEEAEDDGGGERDACIVEILMSHARCSEVTAISLVDDIQITQSDQITQTDIEFVMSRVQCSKAKAISCLQALQAL